MIRTVEELEAIYPAEVVEGARIKVTPRLTPAYARWIAASRFCILTTVGPEGTDGSPRGDDGPVARIVDEQTLWLPDWRGNNRLDSLRNIVRDGRVSLMFLVPGSANVMRVNGRAALTTDPGVLAAFDRDGTLPRSVIVVTVAEVYPQCARAILRAGLWRGTDDSADLPSIGQMMQEIREGFDGAAYDADWPGRAARTMW
jgi:PPOX class probable FMN-dependent enzyme